MDPIACWKQFLELLNDGLFCEVREALDNLIEWGVKEGFWPEEIPLSLSGCQKLHYMMNVWSEEMTKAEVDADTLLKEKWKEMPNPLNLPRPDVCWQRKVKGGHVCVWKSQQFNETWSFYVDCGPNSDRSMSGLNSTMAEAMAESLERAAY